MQISEHEQQQIMYRYADTLEQETLLYIYNGKNPKPRRKLYRLYLAEAQRTFLTIVQNAPDEQHIFPIRRKIRARLTLLTKRLARQSDSVQNQY